MKYKIYGMYDEHGHYNSCIIEVETGKRVWQQCIRHLYYFDEVDENLKKYGIPHDEWMEAEIL